jgi:hypothetical protein
MMGGVDDDDPTRSELADLAADLRELITMAADLQSRMAALERRVEALAPPTNSRPW